MLQDIFQWIIQKIKTVTSGLQRLFMPQMIFEKIKFAVRKCVDKIFHIKPRNEKDYYNIGPLMVSKRLVSMVIFLMGIIGLYYLFVVQMPVFRKGAGGVKTYDYDSVILRFTNGAVKINAKSGYIAYVGEVSKGRANGQGTLYTPRGTVRYEGAFQDNTYHGTGKLYGENENLIYNGEFVRNLYQGQGTLYRDNGTKEYEGEFNKGVKSGNGILYDSGSNQIYEGSFVMDSINYCELLGKTTAEVSEMYSGQRVMYYKDTEFVVDMKDIEAYYAGDSGINSLDGEVLINRIYIHDNRCIIDGKRVDSISAATELMGEPGFEGKSYMNLQEAVVLEQLTEVDYTFEDAVEITDYEKNQELFLTMFEYNEIQYTFYSIEKSNEFIMYSMEKN